MNKGRVADNKGRLADNKGRLADNKGRLAAGLGPVQTRRVYPRLDLINIDEY